MGVQVATYGRTGHWIWEQGDQLWEDRSLDMGRLVTIRGIKLSTGLSGVKGCHLWDQDKVAIYGMGPA